MNTPQKLLKAKTVLMLMFMYLFTYSGNAQTTNDSLLVVKYEKETIYFKGNMTEYIKDNKTHGVGVFMRILKQEFKKVSKEAQEEMSRCIKNRKTGTATIITGSVIMIGSVMALPVLGPASLGVVIVGFIPYAIGAYKLNKSNNQLHKAVWLHNRDVIAQ